MEKRLLSHCQVMVLICLAATGCNARKESNGNELAAAAKKVEEVKAAPAVAKPKIEEVKKVEEPQKPAPASPATAATTATTAATAAAATAASAKEEHVVLTTDIGDIVIDVFEQDTPKHAENFKKLARAGFYDGLTFHRVIEGFMAQGGDPQGTGAGGPGYTIPGEFTRKHVRGSVAAARTGDQMNPKRDSSGSQFYICFRPQPGLDQAGYSVFGQVIKGMEVVDQITRGNPGLNGMVPEGSRTKILKARVVPASEIKP